jgi:3-hydroxyisobutyrate dehydrogenase
MSTGLEVAFLGLGKMGGPMAANLVKSGYHVRGFDPQEVACDVARANGLAIGANVAEAVADAEVVITMLPSGADVLACYRAPDGVLRASKAGALLIDCSTIDISDARDAHRAAAAAGFNSLDAPVSGGVVGATAGTLTFMVGGSEESFRRAEAVLRDMGRRIIHCGAEGTGQAAKICNNMILGVSMVAVCEAFVLAESLGLSHQSMFDVVSNASGQCWALSVNCPVPDLVEASPSNNQYQPGFAASLMLKDLRLATSAADAAKVDAALARDAARIYEEFAAYGGHLDFSAVIDAIRGRPTQANPAPE